MMTLSSLTRPMIRIVGGAMLLLGGGIVAIGCQREGSVEKAGKQVDKAIEDVKEKVNPEGPVEKAGKQVDQAVEDAKDKAKEK